MDDDNKTAYGLTLLPDGTIVDNEAAVEKRANREQEKKAKISQTIALLETGTSQQREYAAKRLGELGADPASLLPLLADRDSRVRSAAARALAGCSITDQRDDVVDLLLSALDDPNDHVVAEAVRSLGLLRVEEARDDLVELLMDPNPLIVEAAILALGRIGKSGDEELLLSFLDSERPGYRVKAAQAMGAMGYRSAIPGIMAELQRGIRNGHIAQKQIPPLKVYVNALGELKATEAIPLLTELATNTIGLRSAAVAALMQMEAVEALPILLRLLGDPSHTLRKEILSMVRRLDYRLALPYIRPLLSDSSTEVRHSALYTVAYWKDTESADSIRWMCYHDGSPYVRRHAVMVLFMILGTDAIADFVNLAQDTNAEVRRAVAESLGLLPFLTPEAETILQTLAEDSMVEGVARKSLDRHNQGSTGTERVIPQSKTRRSLVPARLRPLIPDLITSLKEWQFGLSEDGEVESTDQRPAIAGALAVLLFALEQEHSDEQDPGRLLDPRK